MSPKTIQRNLDNLISLGINKEKVSKAAGLLAMNPETIREHHVHLRNMGISKEKIASQASLLGRNPDTLSRNFEYLINKVCLEESRLKNHPQILMENPDAFAKKMRIFKLETLGLRRGSRFNIDEYARFYMASPASLIAKKKYCINNKIDLGEKLSLLLRSWSYLIRRVNNTLSDKEANREGKRITHPFKQKYDKWMIKYKKWTKDFFKRRGRRLIKNV